MSTPNEKSRHILLDTKLGRIYLVSRSQIS
jgi:hypothetical protein